MKKPTKVPKSPSIMPDCWNAHGKLVTAVPTIVFHALKMTTIELYFSSILAKNRKIIRGEEQVLTR